jgi:hypothetical protein
MSKLYYVECPFPGGGNSSDSWPRIAVLFQALHASSASRLSIERRFRATLRAKVPHTNARNNCLHRRQVGRERTHIGQAFFQGTPARKPLAGALSEPNESQRVVQSIGRARSIRSMTTAPSVAIAAVAALLVYSFGRVVRSPLRRWWKRRDGSNTELHPIKETANTAN